MGTSASLLSVPDRVSKDDCMKFVADQFSEDKWNEVVESDGCISRQKLFELMGKFDVFLTHDWGTDGTNHKNVALINKALKAKGLITWLDEDRMQGNIKKQMVSGIDGSQCIVVFITKRYIDKVGGNNAEDNCQLEFNYAALRKTGALMIPVVMESNVRNTREWTGEVGMVLGPSLYVDYSGSLDSEDNIMSKAEELYSRIISLIKKPYGNQTLSSAPSNVQLQTVVESKAVGELLAKKLQMHMAASSFELLFKAVKIDNPEHITKYIETLAKNKIYNVRLFMMKLSTSADPEVEAEHLSSLLKLHAKRVSPLLTDEKSLLDLKVIKSPNHDHGLQALLASLDILPAEKIAEEINYKLGADDIMEIAENNMWSELANEVQLFKEVPALVELLKTEVEKNKLARVKGTSDAFATSIALKEDGITKEETTIKEAEKMVEEATTGDMTPHTAKSSPLPSAAPPHLVRNYQEVHTFRGHRQCVYSVALLRDQRRVVSGSIDNTLKIWDISTGECLQTLTGHSRSLYCVAVLSDGRIVSSSYDKTLKLWDVDSGQCLKTFKGHGEGVYVVIVLSDGRIASGTFDKTIKIWNIDSVDCEITMNCSNGIVLCLAQLSDGRIAAGVSWSHVQIWNINTQQCEIRNNKIHDKEIRGLAALSNGNIISGGEDMTLKLWNPNMGDILRTYSGHTHFIWCVVLFPDQRTLVSGGDDKTLRIWDVETGESLQTLTGHNSCVYGAAVFSDGRIASASNDATVRLWQHAIG